MQKVDVNICFSFCTTPLIQVSPHSFFLWFTLLHLQQKHPLAESVELVVLFNDGKNEM